MYFDRSRVLAYRDLERIDDDQALSDQRGERRADSRTETRADTRADTRLGHGRSPQRAALTDREMRERWPIG